MKTSLVQEKPKKSAKVITPSKQTTNLKNIKPAAAKKLETTIEIDYPIESEKVWAGHYAVRMTALNAKEVELSINGGDWQEGRDSLGHYWYDWWPLNPGTYKINARAKGADGKFVKSKTRTCKVSDPS